MEALHPPLATYWTMVWVDTPSCTFGSTAKWGCNHRHKCKPCRLKYNRQRRLWVRKVVKEKKRQVYIKSIMKVALDIEHSFEDLCPQHRPELVSFARRYTGNEFTAEDLVQEVMLKAFRHWKTGFKQETSDLNNDVRLWLKKILTNTFYTEWHRDQRRAEAYEEYATELDEGSYSEESDEEARVKRVMAKLRPMYQEVLELHYVQGKSYQEIADTLNIKFVQVQKRLYRARQYIKTFYEQAGLNVSRGPLRGTVRVNSAATEAPQGIKPEADTVNRVVRRDNVKPLRRTKSVPDTDTSR
jgi:RNA polymerase sigma-70 factor, ECF subfamily